jgi:hypothetical protein
MGTCSAESVGAIFFGTFRGSVSTTGFGPAKRPAFRAFAKTVRSFPRT